MAANSICWKLPSKFSFFSSKHNRKIEVQPYIVEFRRLLTCSTVGFQEVSNVDLLHSVVGLYDVCLPDITPEVLYPTVCAKWAKTLILVRSYSDIINEMKEKYGQKENSAVESGGQTTEPVASSFLSEKEENSFLTEKHVRWEDQDLESEKLDENDKIHNVEEKSKQSDSSDNSSENSSADEEEDLTPKEKDIVAQITEQKDTKEPDKLISGAVDSGASDSGVSLCRPKKKEEEDVEPGKFDGIFSDSEGEAVESEEEDDDEEDYSTGVDDFIAAALERKGQVHQGIVNRDTVGIESVLIGAATYERCYSNPREKVVQLSLLSMRKRYRKCGLGKRLIETIKDPTIMGSYDSIAVYADNDAVEFFKKNGFSDDVVLNSRFTELADHWINSTLMCYLPPFTGSDISGVFRSDFEIKAMDQEMEKWREKSLEAYQAQMSCMVRMKHEIKTLKAMVDTQDNVIKILTSAKERLLKEKYKLEKQLLDFKAKDIDSGWSFGDDSEDEDNFYESLASILSKHHDGETEHQLDYQAISKGHFSEVSKEDEQLLSSLVHSQQEKHVMQHVRRSLMSTHLYSDVTVLNITQVKSSHVTLLATTFESPAGSARVNDATTSHQLYFCGGSCEDSLNRIITRGFSKEDFNSGLYGRGLYFTTHPAQASRFTVAGKLLLANVKLGSTDMTPRQDKRRVLPPAGYDSILAVPAYLIEYTTTKK
ncbi:uncharacterized protein LOC116620093 isoform X2 [Nematostella vectensis]|uniref:uncharacterized protein LOC116620093 isoform X2 n=1 Tax=Nematostella vectensis TaxID=45351 RepID=UPI00138F9EA3|nr:uncharacterized protein LOC116620093 isoform X2 [Nematostella vectensis]